MSYHSTRLLLWDSVEQPRPRLTHDEMDFCFALWEGKGPSVHGKRPTKNAAIAEEEREGERARNENKGIKRKISFSLGK